MTDILGLPARAEVLAEYTTYGEAQTLVDRLSDAEFPVQYVWIIGDGLHTVEQVTGRPKRRSSAYGAAVGAWFGLLVGLLFALFATGFGVAAVLLGSLAIGTVWGAVFSLVMQWSTGGQSDFSSVNQILAARYTVAVDVGRVGEARKIMGRS
jgi:hypothetical protein